VGRRSNGGDREGSSALYVGIDLGTSCSAVCASNGVRKWIESIVGWPKDVIARKLIGRPIVFGEENHRLRLSLEQYRPLQSGVITKGPDRGEEAARELVKHLVSLAEPVPGQKIFLVIGAPSQATAYNKQAIRDAVAALVEGVMIVSEPFTVAYSLGALDRSLIIDMGGGTVDLCVMHGVIPSESDQSSIPQAGDAIDAQLHQFLSERYPEAAFTRNMVRQFKEANAFVGPPTAPVVVTMPVAGKPTAFDITEPLRRACESILPYLREALHERIAAIDPEFQEAVRQNVVLAGGSSQIRGLGTAVGDMLEELGGGRVHVVEDPIFTGAAGALAIASDTPAEDWTRLRSEPDLVL
jgi:rod shape-determining protein MreB and related proteins